MRFTVIAALASASMVLLTCWALDLAESCGTSLLPQVHARNAAVSRLRHDRDEYAHRLDAAVADLEAGPTSLRTAVGRLEAYAAEHYPALFMHLATLEPTRPQSQRIASMLMRHCSKQRSGPERWAQLVSEYEAWVAEERE